LTDRVQGERIPGLDELRGIAVLLVFAEHWAQYQLPQWEKAWPRVGVIAAAAAVDMFFVISGFLITRGLLQDRGRPEYFRGFYLRRAARILPLALLCVLFSAWRFPSTRDLWPGYLLFYSNYQMAMLDGRTMLGLGPMWSLAVEEQFYLLWPLLIALVPPRFLWMPVSLLALVLALWPVVAGPNGVSVVSGLYLTAGRTHLRGLTLMLGAGLALYAFELLPRPRLLVAGLAAGYLGTALYLGRVAGWLTFPAAALLVLVVGLAVTGPGAFRSSVLAWLGARCYGVYLLHSFVLIELATVPFRMPVAVHGVLTLGACALLAAVSFRWLERPFVRWASGIVRPQRAAATRPRASVPA
jgi:peptidoglycan/LPS O-acetylase OafA/YrhL